MASDRDAAVREALNELEIAVVGKSQHFTGSTTTGKRYWEDAVRRCRQRVLTLLDFPAPETTAPFEIEVSTDDGELHVEVITSRAFDGVRDGTYKAYIEGVAPESVEPPDAYMVTVPDPDGVRMPYVELWTARNRVRAEAQAKELAGSCVPLFRHPPTDSTPSPIAWASDKGLADLRAGGVAGVSCLKDKPDACDLEQFLFRHPLYARPQPDSTPVGEGDAAALIAVFEAAALGSCDVSRDEAYDALLAALRTSKEAPATEWVDEFPGQVGWYWYRGWEGPEPSVVYVEKFNGEFWLDSRVADDVESMKGVQWLGPISPEAPAAAPAESDPNRFCFDCYKDEHGDTPEVAHHRYSPHERPEHEECEYHRAYGEGWDAGYEVGSAPAGEVGPFRKYEGVHKNGLRVIVVGPEFEDEGELWVPVVVPSESRRCTAFESHLIRAEDPPSEEGELCHACHFESGGHEAEVEGLHDWPCKDHGEEVSPNPTSSKEGQP